MYKLVKKVESFSKKKKTNKAKDAALSLISLVYTEMINYIFSFTKFLKMFVPKYLRLPRMRQ